MPVVTSHPNGAPCWFELATTDQKDANRFYTGIFGWTIFDAPIGPDMFYSMYKKNGSDVGAAYTMMPDMKKGGIPPHWLVYFAADDIDRTASKVADLGGTLIKGPFDVMGQGDMAVCRDPGGAHFALWKGKAHMGSTIVGEPETVCWSELTTRDSGSATKFYTELLGWTSKPYANMPTYTEVGVGNRMHGGIMEMDKEWGEMPPFWGIYFMVNDCDATAAKVSATGGKVCHGPFDVPGVGRMAVLSDPQGAMFSVIKLSQ